MIRIGFEKGAELAKRLMLAAVFKVNEATGMALTRRLAMPHVGQGVKGRPSGRVFLHKLEANLQRGLAVPSLGVDVGDAGEQLRSPDGVSFQQQLVELETAIEVARRGVEGRHIEAR